MYSTVIFLDLHSFSTAWFSPALSIRTCLTFCSRPLKKSNVSATISTNLLFSYWKELIIFPENSSIIPYQNILFRIDLCHFPPVKGKGPVISTYKRSPTSFDFFSSGLDLAIGLALVLIKPHASHAVSFPTRRSPLRVAILRNLASPKCPHLSCASFIENGSNLDSSTSVSLNVTLGFSFGFFFTGSSSSSSLSLSSSRPLLINSGNSKSSSFSLSSSSDMTAGSSTFRVV